MGTLSIWLNPPRETPVDRAIREEGERQELPPSRPWPSARCNSAQVANVAAICDACFSKAVIA
jgi:hypothetical protein